MDCVTTSYVGVPGFSFTEEEQKFVRVLFVHNPPYFYLMDSVNCPQSYSCIGNSVEHLMLQPAVDVTLSRFLLSRSPFILS